MIELSRAEARRLMLTAQGLGARPEAAAAKIDVLACIGRLGALQIDTISVVNRSPYFVLWSRLGPFDLSWLEQLLAEHRIFEGWAHAACFLPMDDYPLFRSAGLERWRLSSRRWLASRPELADQVLERIRLEGALRSADFEAAEKRPGGWWNWKDEKRALEALFDAGKLMIAGRRNFQRLYDLSERVLPEWDEEQAPDRASAERALALKAVIALGVATAAWVREYFRSLGRGIGTHLESLADEGLLDRVKIEKIKQPAYIATTEPAAGSLLPNGEAVMLLSPFDPIVADRARALELFDFDYRIECYTPAAKRRYGYFTLPILWRERLVGRLDPKAHRREGIFEVKSLHLEPDFEIDDGFLDGLAETLRDCAGWHGTPQVLVRESAVAGLATEINRRAEKASK